MLSHGADNPIFCTGEKIRATAQRNVVDPEDDAEFKKAIKQNRVLTVKQETVGSKRDFGTIGFRKDKNVSYLVFPKALPKEDKHVVGIKYDLLDQPKTKDPVSERPQRQSQHPLSRHTQLFHHQIVRFSHRFLLSIV